LGAWAAGDQAAGAPTVQGMLAGWQVGQQWQVQSQTYQMQATDNPKWLPPVSWQYKVTGEQDVAGTPCFVVQVTQQGQTGPAMKMYVGKQNLNLLQLDSTVTVGGQKQVVTQQFQQGQDSFIYELGPAPCLLPQPQGQLPVSLGAGQKAAPSVRTIKAVVSTGPGLSFEAEETQTVEAISFDQLSTVVPKPPAGVRSALLAGGLKADQNLYRVNLEAPGIKAMQVVGSRTPWPVYTETATLRAWLVGFGNQ
jgi:hypothetical protein